MKATARGRIEWIHKNLLDEWSRHGTRSPTTLHAIRQLLHQLERELQCDSERSPLSEKATSVVHRDLLEIGVFHAALTGDMGRFEECVTRMETFYTLSGCDSVSESRQLVHGLHLMHLLSSRRIAQFHTLIEQIDPHMRENNPFISVPTQLEQYIAEGAYDKLLLEESVIPSTLYTTFMTALISGVRGEIASCVEKSHDATGMDASDAVRKLLLHRKSDLVDFAAKRGWRVVGDRLHFQNLSETDIHLSAEAPSACAEGSRLIKQLTFYAKQLEMIV